MTFSITGHCSRTDMTGVAITTSSIAVGSRCPHARAGVGAVATQNITDPSLAVVCESVVAAHAALAIAMNVWVMGHLQRMPDLKAPEPRPAS